MFQRGTGTSAVRWGVSILHRFYGSLHLVLQNLSLQRATLLAEEEGIGYPFKGARVANAIL
jgi:hypothetical protein